MQRAHLEQEPGVLLQLVRRPVAVRGGATQGAEEIERHQDAVDHEADCARGSEEVQVQPFYAMCLYNVGRHKEATSLLLKLLVSTTNSEAIQGYQRAILGYAEDLDRQW